MWNGEDVTTTTKRRSKRTRKSKSSESSKCNVDVSQIDALSNLSISHRKENVINGTAETLACMKMATTKRKSKPSESNKCNVGVSQINDVSNLFIIRRKKNVENGIAEAAACKKKTTTPSKSNKCNNDVSQINDVSNLFIIRRKKNVENGITGAAACKKKTTTKRKPSKSNKCNTDVSQIDDLSNLSISQRKENIETGAVKAPVRKKKTGSNNWEQFVTSTKIKKKEEKDEFDIDLVDDDTQAKLKRANNIVAIDCEMVGVGEGGEKNMLARVSIVNSLGDCLYDTFVKPTAPVTDYRTFVSGVRPENLKNAKEFSAVQKRVLALIKDRILVGHAIHHDFRVLKIRHPPRKIRDTAQFKKFHQIGVGGTPSLKTLTSHFLNVDIQCGEHSSVQDAQAAMQLYMLYRKEWEADVVKRRNAVSSHDYHHPTKKKSKPSHKPKRFGRNYKS